MDKYNDNKATPTKRTGENKGTSSTDVEYDNNNNSSQRIAPEILQPNPTTATPNIPTEMPSREIK